MALYEGYPDADSGKLPAGNAVEMSVDGAVFEAAVVSKNETNFIKSGTFDAEIPVEYIAEDSLLIRRGTAATLLQTARRQPRTASLS